MTLNLSQSMQNIKNFDKAGLATSAATTAGGMLFHIPLLSEGVSFVKGVWKNPENNRLKSGVVQVYKDSPLSYVEEGKDVYITKDTMFLLKFKSSDSEDLDGVPTNNVTPVNTVNKLPVPEQTAPKHIETVHPEDVLREVELNSK